MKLFLITLFVFGLVILGMSIGVILGNRCIKGSCGGLGNCEACRDGSTDSETEVRRKSGEIPEAKGDWSQSVG
ncbi:MAG: hypothetical protein DF168_02243 [Candidatus Moanabacter tarae]|uniref:(Na+)-NQR maturation NqrM n=1 Tax=Candidatus Moanibacter tarae TaxID=2200854 RepID=A0A2Z4AID7_9BACT|nr:MAG: hypothetical protein DF168_02243 [Candidatus Moanabacter tarae]|tara:strand:- start:58503 stop:58721 length:219 start_codon:yes stop_codon:yes gene_type:complete